MFEPTTHFYNMHTARRQGEAKSSYMGCAKTEEWLHLDVNFNKPIQKDLQAQCSMQKGSITNHNKILEFVQAMVKAVNNVWTLKNKTIFLDLANWLELAKLLLL